MTPEEKTNLETVTRFIKLVEKQDTKGFLSLYHPEGTCWTSGNTMISGTFTLEQITPLADGLFELFPEGLKMTIHATTVQGNRVAMEAESNGRHKNGKYYNQHYHFLFVLKDGKILRYKEYFDTERVTDVMCDGQRPPHKDKIERSPE